MEMKQESFKSGNYDSDRKWSDRFIPAIKKAIGPFLLSVSSDHVDMTMASDLVVIQTKIKNIACRIRRANYRKTYPYDFTIRSARDSGAKTELSKIREGFVDWMFYGFEDDEESCSLARYFIIDLDIFRKHEKKNKTTGEIKL